jgi:hypothetical protein
MTMPQFGDLVKLTTDNWQEMPDSPMPYYVGAKDGLFAMRRLLFGRGIVRMKFWPDNFKEVGDSIGEFVFEAGPIPAKIMGQIVSFFQRIYALQKTEAAVLLTMNVTTKEWDVFVPTQLVSHGGVNYVYDPQHIQGGRIVVGSIHSHADFSPFHSGTDTGDAEDFDGFHATIGFVNTTPKIVAMVSLNKQNMHYKAEQFPALFDWSEIDQHEAPPWWDNYVGTADNKQKPIGFDLYAKFAKPTAIKTESKAITTYQPTTPHNWTPRPYGMQSTYDPAKQSEQQAMSDWGLSSYRSIPAKPWWEGRSAQWLQDNGYQWDDKAKKYTYVGHTVTASKPLTESEAFNARRAAERGADWDKEDGSLNVHLLSKEEQDILWAMWKGADDEAFWENTLPDNVVESLMASDCVTDEDIEYALAAPRIAGEIEFWQEKFMHKTMGAIAALRAMGVEASVTIKVSNPITKTSEDFLLPGEPKQIGATDAVL